MFICCGVGEVSVRAMGMCGDRRQLLGVGFFFFFPLYHMVAGIKCRSSGLPASVPHLLSHLAIPKHPVFPGQENVEAFHSTQTLLIPKISSPVTPVIK